MEFLYACVFFFLGLSGGHLWGIYHFFMNSVHTQIDWPGWWVGDMTIIEFQPYPTFQLSTWEKTGEIGTIDSLIQSGVDS